jgi:hypothetical protein
MTESAYNSEICFEGSTAQETFLCETVHINENHDEPKDYLISVKNLMEGHSENDEILHSDADENDADEHISLKFGTGRKADLTI